MTNEQRQQDIEDATTEDLRLALTFSGQTAATLVAVKREIDKRTI